MTQMPVHNANNGDSPHSIPRNLIFENLVQSRTVTLFKGVNAESAREVIESLLLLEAQNPKEPITLFVNSPGGEVNSGFGIYDTIRFIQPEVRIVCAGLCASIATIILIAAKKENRIALPNSKFLIHQPLISGVIRGQAVDIQIHADQIDKTRSKINELLAKETGQPLERVEKDTDRDYWMSANEAKEYGLINRIIQTRKELQ